jgi:hypothetical protein
VFVLTFDETLFHVLDDTYLANSAATLPASANASAANGVILYPQTSWLAKGNLRAQSGKLNAIFLNPPRHLMNVGETKFFNIPLVPSNICLLIRIRAILRRMLGLRRVFQWMAVLKDRRYTTSSRSKYRWI